MNQLSVARSPCIVDHVPVTFGCRLVRQNLRTQYYQVSWPEPDVRCIRLIAIGLVWVFGRIRCGRSGVIDKRTDRGARGGLYRSHQPVAGALRRDNCTGTRNSKDAILGHSRNSWELPFNRRLPVHIEVQRHRVERQGTASHPILRSARTRIKESSIGGLTRSTSSTRFEPTTGIFMPFDNTDRCPIDSVVGFLARLGRIGAQTRLSWNGDKIVRHA